jgi:transposase
MSESIVQETVKDAPVKSSTEVAGVATRRAFSDAYKRRILEEVDRAQAGEIGLILRREGLYSSQLAVWGKWRSGMTSKKKKTGKEVVDMAAYKRLEKENAKLKLKLRKAEAMLELQKKAAEILGYDKEETQGSDS